MPVLVATSESFNNAAAHALGWLNQASNLLGRLIAWPLATLPGWLSATLIAVVTGVLLLVIFKYTSNQSAIKRVRDDIKANLLSLKLFKDSAAVVVKAQGRVFLGALRLFLLALVPMLVMTIPVCLLMAQIGLWYQWRPLEVDQPATLTLYLNNDSETTLPEVKLDAGDAIVVEAGPVKAASEMAVDWRVHGLRPGYHRLVFNVNGESVEKELAVGEGFMRVSMMRPGMNWLDRLLYPWETPFDANSPYRSISVYYPGTERDSWTSGTDWWIIYWFGVSMIAALAFRRVLNVNI